MNNKIIIDGVGYVRADSVNGYPATNTEGMPYVICRGYYCGVHAGYIKAHDGNHATLVNSRRLWQWKANSGISLSSLAMTGLADGVALPCALPEIWLGDVYEVITCSTRARESIVEAPIREQD